MTKHQIMEIKEVAVSIRKRTSVKTLRVLAEDPTKSSGVSPPYVYLSKEA